MNRLALLIFLAMTSAAFADEGFSPTPAPPAPTSPTVMLTAPELELHDQFVGQRAIATQLVHDAYEKARAVEMKIGAAFKPK